MGRIQAASNVTIDLGPAKPSAFGTQTDDHGTTMSTVPGTTLPVERTAIIGLGALSRRLGSMSSWRWDRVWFAASLFFLGAAVGSLDGFMLITHRSHSQTVRGITGIVFTLVFALACLLAGLAVRSERADSVQAIKGDLDAILEDPEPDALSA